MNNTNNMSAALVMHPDGEIVEVTMRPGGDHLALMREHLDCRLVDCVALTDRIDMWLDDDGMYVNETRQPRGHRPGATASSGRTTAAPCCWPGVDRAGKALEAVRAIRDNIDTRVRALLHELLPTRR